MTLTPEIRILLADDHLLVRSGIRALLGHIPGLTVVAEAGDGHEALQLTRDLCPEVLLSDIAMPGLNGLSLAARVSAELPGTRVIILSMHNSDAYLLEAIRAGASGYLLKDASLIELELAIRSVVAGGTHFTPSVSKRMVDAYLRQSDSPRDTSAASPQLTMRQREVLQAIAEGLGTKDIARKLDVSVKTVETHRADLMRRLGIFEVAGLVRYAIQNGIASAE